MGRIAEKGQTSARIVESLCTLRSDRQIVGTIEGIADQANLVALNAPWNQIATDNSTAV
jgi:methyl-accepting chemotaxis protein